MIFSIGVVAVLEALTAGVRSTSTALGYARATPLAQKVMEETIVEDMLMDAPTEGDFGAGWPGYAWRLEAEETDVEDLYEARVTVTWTERGSEQRYALTTLVASP